MKSRQKNRRDSRSRETEVGEKIAATNKYIFDQAFHRLILLIQKNEKINILSLQFMTFIENKSAGASFGTLTCRFHISTALSELNVPLQP